MALRAKTTLSVDPGTGKVKEKREIDKVIGRVERDEKEWWSPKTKRLYALLGIREGACVALLRAREYQWYHHCLFCELGGTYKSTGVLDPLEVEVFDTGTPPKGWYRDEGEGGAFRCDDCASICGFDEEGGGDYRSQLARCWKEACEARRHWQKASMSDICRETLIKTPVDPRIPPAKRQKREFVDETNKKAL